MKKILQQLTTPVEIAVRSQQIGVVFTRYGIAGALASLGIEAGRRGLNVVGAAGKPVPFDAVFGKNLAKTFVKLGPTFIKLGQILATRPDFAGEQVADELKVLFDRVPPISYREIQRILKSQLGKEKVAASFKSINPKPLASASLSQTHQAELADGTPVILKVQKKGVAHLVRMDLKILEAFVRSIDLVYPKLQLGQMFQDFKVSTLSEIDYREEAKNIDRFRKNYHSLFSTPDVLFPRYFPELSTEKVITMEPMQGRKFAELRRGSTVARTAATLSLNAVLEQIFDHGFFHADPHAGNLFFLEDEGRVGFIDLGLVGQLQPEDKRKFLKVLMAILQRDRARLARNLFDLGTPDKKTDYPAFERAVQGLLDEVKKRGVDNIRIEEMVNRLLVISRRNRLHIPNRYVMMIRSCLVIEGLARSLDPGISVFSKAAPIVARSLMKTYNPFSIFRRR
jgi:ubiquinone biosynthesis protein